MNRKVKITSVVAGAFLPIRIVEVVFVISIFLLVFSFIFNIEIHYFLALLLVCFFGYVISVAVQLALLPLGKYLDVDINGGMLVVRFPAFVLRYKISDFLIDGDSYTLKAPNRFYRFYVRFKLEPIDNSGNQLQ